MTKQDRTAVRIAGGGSDGQLLRSTQAESFPGSAVGALLELIDNGFDAHATRVDISWEAKSRILECLDNGHGMEDLGVLFHLGDSDASTNGSIDRIGLWGIGGTKAMIWLSDEITVWTLSERDHKVRKVRVVWADHFDTREIYVEPTIEDANLENTPTQLYERGHGTLIRMHLRGGSEKRIKFVPEKVKQELERKYAMTEGRRITFNGTDLRFDLPLEKSRPLLGAIDYKGDTLAYSGEVGHVDRKHWASGRIALMYGPRVVRWAYECMDDGSGKFGGPGISGKVQLDRLWHDQGLLDQTKSDLTHDAVGDALYLDIFLKIKDLLEEATQNRMQLEARNLGSLLSQVLATKPQERSVTRKDERTGWIQVRERRVKPPPDPNKKRRRKKVKPPKHTWPEPDENGTKRAKLKNLPTIQIVYKPADMIEGGVCNWDIKDFGKSLVAYVNDEYESRDELMVGAAVFSRLGVVLMDKGDEARSYGWFTQEQYDQAETLLPTKKADYFSNLLLQKWRDIDTRRPTGAMSDTER